MSPLLPAVLAGLAVVVLLGVRVSRPGVLVPLAPARTARALRAPVVAAGVGGLLVVPAGPVGAATGALVAVVVIRAREQQARAAERRAERAGATEALGVLAAELRAGRAPSTALARAAAVASGPTARALSEAAGETSLGDGAGAALARYADQSAEPRLLTSLSVCWQVCQGAGSSLAVAVDRLEDALQADQATREEVEADLEGPRTSARLLAVMPLFGLALGAGLGGHPVHVLLRTRVGWACLVVGVGLELVGLWWTGRIVRAAGGAD